MIRQIEELAVNAWSATHTIIYDGWVLRYAQGYTRRANAVYPLYPSARPIEEKLAYCEAYYNGHGLPTVFKMTEAAMPPKLDRLLANAGYERISPTSVRTIDLANVTTVDNIPGYSIDIRTYPSNLWLDAFGTLNRVRPIFLPVMRQMLLDHRALPGYFVMLWQGRTPVATAMCAVERGYAGIFDVVVAEDQRGRGLGTWMMRYLLGVAHDAHAHTAYLQVEPHNIAAVRLYDKLGFQERYQYWYREKPIPV